MNSEETIVPTTEVVIETIPATETAPVLEEEKTHVYQPTDESGRPIGGKQVLKYRTHDELINKIQEQNVLLIRKLRQQTRDNRLGISHNADIPAESPRLKDPVQFNPRTLSADERVMLSRDLLDPDRFQEASDMLFEASLGAKPQQLREMLSDMQQKNIQMLAKAESDAFVAANPDYVKCAENSDAITNWMVRYNLAPVRENFQKAYDTLRYDGIIVERGEAPETTTVQHTETAVTHETEQVVTQPTPPPPPARVPGISSGLTRSQATNTGTAVPVGSDIVYELTLPNGQKRTYTGAAALDAMPSDEYKRRINSDKSFAKRVEKLLNK